MELDLLTSSSGENIPGIVNEIDIEQIKTEITAIKTYFSSSDPAEFSYTLDDAELSFEE